MTTVTVKQSHDFTAWPAAAIAAGDDLRKQKMDLQLIVEDRIHLGLWWNDVPLVPEKRLGVIGHFHAHDACDELSVHQALEVACEHLRKVGCTHAVGPMNGNTWRAYRFLTWLGDEPLFIFERNQPATWPQWWEKAGFVVSENYWSALMDNLAVHDPRLDVVAKRLEQSGVVIREIQIDKFEKELISMFPASELAFANNVLYAPITKEEFLAMYMPVKPLLKPGLSFVAVQGENVVGFIFTIPDIEQAKRGQQIDTIVVKTLGVIPGRAYAGLGKLLLERCQHSAYTLGFRRAIHALMHHGNTSRNLGDGAHEIRRYTLYEKLLA